MRPTLIQSVAAVVCAIAPHHRFFTKFFERLLPQHSEQEDVVHLLSEVEVIFGFWFLVLVTLYVVVNGSHVTFGLIEGGSMK